MRDPRSNLRARSWLVPTALAVASFAPACAKEDTPTTGGSSETTVATTTPTTSGTTTAPTSTSSTTGGELPDCKLYNDDPETCASMVACLYIHEECIVRCNNFTDQATCEMQELCYWLDGCYLAV
jgi:hypothetical protein